MTPLSPSRCVIPFLRASRLRSTAACLLLSGMAVLAASPARTQTQPTLLQRLRAMLGIIRPISVGGSRAALPSPPKPADVALISAGLLPSSSPAEPSNSTGAVSSAMVPFPADAGSLPPAAAQLRSGDTTAASLGAARVPVAGPPSGELCLLSPWVEQVHGVSPSVTANGSVAAPGIAVAITPSGAPPIASVTHLADVEIWRGATLLWQGRSTSTAPLANPMAWPLPPLKPGETVQLRLRLPAAQDSSALSVQLRRPLALDSASPAPGSDPTLELETLLERGRHAEAMERLFQSALEGNADLGKLARTALASGCRGLASQLPSGR